MAAEDEAGAGDGDGTAGRDGDDQPQHECPECGQGFSTKATLGFHRYRQHGVAGSSRKKNQAAAARKSGGGDGDEGSPRRPGRGGSKSTRSRLVSETMVELADLADSLRGRGPEDAATIAETIRRDADRMGDALAGLAERSIFGFLGPIIDTLFGAGGPLSMFTAFGPTIRKTLAARSERAGRDMSELQAEYERIYTADGPDVAAAWAREQGLEVAGGSGG